MNRRAFVGLGVCALAGIPSTARLQQPRVYRIGYLHPTNSQDVAAIAFRQALKGHGYVVGQNVILEERFAENNVDRMPAMAADLVAKRVDIIVAVSPVAIRAARGATQTAVGLSVLLFRGGRRTRFLRPRYHRHVGPRRRLRRQDIEGSESGRAADRATAEALPGYQSQGCEHAGACDSANVAAAGGSGGSVTSVTVSGSTRDFCTTG